MTEDFNKYFDNQEKMEQGTTLDRGEELVANIHKCLEGEKNFHVSLCQAINYIHSEMFSKRKRMAI